MKIYDEGLYRVIEVDADQFNRIEKYQLHSNRDDTKLLLGYIAERMYLSEILDIEPIELELTDYYKVVKV